jgi:hypothetical protein
MPFFSPSHLLYTHLYFIDHHRHHDVALYQPPISAFGYAYGSAALNSERNDVNLYHTYYYFHT